MCDSLVISIQSANSDKIIQERPCETRDMELPPSQVEELSNTDISAEICQCRNYRFPASLFGEGKKGKKYQKSISRKLASEVHLILL